MSEALAKLLLASALMLLPMAEMNSLAKVEKCLKEAVKELKDSDIELAERILDEAGELNDEDRRYLWYCILVVVASRNGRADLEKFEQCLTSF